MIQIRQTKTYIIFILGFIFVSFGVPLQANAAPAGTQGITVSPAFITIVISANDQEQSGSVGVKNNYSTAVSLAAELKGVDQESGALTPNKDLDNDLKSIVSLNENRFIIQPNQSINIKVTVNNSTLLKPGGTYLALVIRQINDANNTVGLQSAISAGVFITKEEGAVRQLAVASFEVQQFLFSEPSKAEVSFKNNGNVLLVPRGTVLITDKKINTFYKKGIVNQESISIFPSKSITLAVPLKNINNSYFPSKQNAILQYRYDGSDAIISVTKTFLYIPLYFLIFGVCMLLALCIGVFNVKKKFGSKKQKTNQNRDKKSNVKTIVIKDQTDGEKITVRKG